MQGPTNLSSYISWSQPNDQLPAAIVSVSLGLRLSLKPQGKAGKAALPPASVGEVPPPSGGVTEAPVWCLFLELPLGIMFKSPIVGVCFMPHPLLSAFPFLVFPILGLMFLGIASQINTVTLKYASEAVLLGRCKVREPASPLSFPALHGWCGLGGVGQSIWLVQGASKNPISETFWGGMLSTPAG